MIMDQENAMPRHETILDAATKLGPWAGAIIAGISIVWATSNNISSLETTQNYQAQQIIQLIKTTTDQQALSYSISNQLAQLQQSVADIKSSLPNRANQP